MRIIIIACWHPNKKKAFHDLAVRTNKDCGQRLIAGIINNNE